MRLVSKSRATFAVKSRRISSALRTSVATAGCVTVAAYRSAVNEPRRTRARAKGRRRPSAAARRQQQQRAPEARSSGAGVPPSRGFAGYDHIDARVRDLASARRFYDILMPELGLTEIKLFESGTEYYEPYRQGASRRFFGIHEDPEHHTNESRICFSADTPAD